MKQIGEDIGVNESRVSQLHARATRRLRDAMLKLMSPAEAGPALRSAILAFKQKPTMLKASLDRQAWAAVGDRASNGVTRPGVVVKHPAAARSANTLRIVKPLPQQAVARKKVAKIASRPMARAVAAAR